MNKIYFIIIVLILALFMNIGGVCAVNVTTDQVANASGTLKSYVEANHTLPTNTNVSGNQVSMSQYLKLSTTAVLNINNTSNSTIAITSCNNPTAPSETITTRNINKTEYLDIANRVKTYIGTNGRAPNYASTSTGTIRYESLIYLYSQILSSYKINGVLPDYITINPWAVVSNASTSFISIDQVNNASDRVKTYIETNNRLPNYVTISGIQVTMPQFLGLSTTALLNIKAKLNASIILKNYGNATDPSETLRSGNITSTEYLDITSRVKSFMETNAKAPNYASTSLGNMRFESLVYNFSRILSYYSTSNKTLPSSIRVAPWINSTSVIGSKNYGYVEKEFYGNQSSNQTIMLIIGVHPLENGIHTAIFNALVNKSLDLTKRFVIYKIHVTQDADDYSKGRMNGQLLGQEFVVPDVTNENPMLVLDNHENHYLDSGYDYCRFLYPISNTTITTAYVNEIISQMPFLVSYSPPNPTSTQYITVPIANQGITTIIYETYINDSLAKKQSDANELISALDILGVESQNKLFAADLIPSVTANHTGGIFNTSQIVELIKTDLSSTAIIYYTLDGSDPQTSDTRAEYTAPIEIDSDKTLKFVTFDSTDSNWSSVYTENYVIDDTIPTATLSPAGGIFNSIQNVELSTEPGATVYYTLDGSDPRTSSTRHIYSDLILINTSKTLKFAAIDSASNWSPLYAETYLIDTTAPTVNAVPAGRNYHGPQTVVLTSSEVSDIYYTTDGTEPTKNSTKYPGPLSIETSKTLKFTAWDIAGNQAQIYIENYSIYKPEAYKYTVKVLYKKVRHKGWYKAPYKVKVKAGKYKIGKIWKYTYKYVTKYKMKRGWHSHRLYRNETRWNNHWVLT